MRRGLKDQTGEGGKDGRGLGREDHFLPHKFLKGTFHAKMGSIKDRNGMDQRTVKMAEE